MTRAYKLYLELIVASLR